MKFSAVILAGGKSSRMGCDKALLQLDGLSLLARQIGLVLSIGASEVFISGRKDADYSAFGCRVLQDRFDDAGPLAGIERALDAASLPLLLVLAVDLPQMSAEFLGRLAANCTATTGAIPRISGQVEPLGAFYPTKMKLELLRAGSETGVPGARDFAARCVTGKLAVYVDCGTRDAKYFRNWNSPADIDSACRT
ncbi:MAG: molybdenum cofactor guanylyltransferase [Verrucomicrobia bacterium]|nr:molybdenum cofactor guanylyltransferase [Verrucomicrobiota bacterium]